MVTDPKRLQQVLKNLLSNAFKFTSAGGVRLNVSVAASGWTAEHPVLDTAPTVVALEVSDTGVGIPAEKQRIIFERSSRPTRGRAAGTAVRGSGWRSAANWRRCWAARSTAKRSRSEHLHALHPAALRRPAAPKPVEVMPVSDGQAIRSGLGPESGRPNASSSACRRSRRPGARGHDSPDRGRHPHYRGSCSTSRTATGSRGRRPEWRGCAGAGATRQSERRLAWMSSARHAGWTVLSQLKQDPATRHIAGVRW